jgi:hypothetical protein
MTTLFFIYVVLNSPPPYTCGGGGDRLPYEVTREKRETRRDETRLACNRAANFAVPRIEKLDCILLYTYKHEHEHEIQCNKCVTT